MAIDEDCIDLAALAANEQTKKFAETRGSYELPEYNDHRVPAGYRATPYGSKEVQKEDSVEVNCPKCDNPLVRRIRKVDGVVFYGCSEYFNTGCRGAMDEASYAEASIEARRNKAKKL